MSESSLNQKLAGALAHNNEIGAWGSRVDQLRTEITGSNPNTTNVLLAGFAECRLALGGEYAGYLDAATQYATAPGGQYDFDPDKLVATVGAPMSHEKTAGHISREKYGILYFLLLLVLFMIVATGCTPAPAGASFETDTPDAPQPTVDAPTIVAPTEEPHVIPTIGASETPIAVDPDPTVEMDPTDEPTPTLEATSEPIAAIPDYAVDFAEGGYCSMETEPGSQHVIFDETSLEYAPTSDGILHNGVRIFSWFNNVTYFGEDGQYHTGIVLNNTCAVGGDNDGRFTSALTDGSQITPNRACPGMPYFQGQNRDLLQALPGDFHILKAFFGAGHDVNKDMVFGGIFSGLTSPTDTVNIPGIGDNILPITVFRSPNPPIQ